MVEAGYYRCVVTHEEAETGDLAYAVGAEDPGKVDVLVGGSHYIYDLEEFLGVFESAPDGAQEQQDEIDQLLGEIADAETGFKALSLKMLNFSPHVEDNELAGAGSLVPQKDVRTPAAVKKVVAEVRNTIGRTKQQLDRKRTQLAALVEARSTALQLRVDEMNRMLARANEAIWTINLYLGKDEEIRRLAKGEPAPKDEPITLRQRVLYMDEECADLADGQGIDITQISTFDEWLLRDDNLTTLLPESKGIVCLHTRARSKEYEDPWTSAQMNQANLSYTYFLIRNGDNVYRIYADIVLSNVLFPSAREYEQLFQKTEFDWDTHTSQTKVIRPGDDDYMKAMDRCEAKQRHYLRVLLILQGLIDRTDVFKPLPVERINICDRVDYDRFLRFVFDTGESVLDDGKPSFSDWLGQVNSNIAIGHRVVGAFGSYRARLHGTSDRWGWSGGRLYPRNSETPLEDQLYTIERADEKSRPPKFFFLYDRGEIWDRDNWESRPARVRGSCLIYRSDTWVLDFDAAELEDIKYYRGSRKGKKDYQDMVPILDLALRLKAAETKEEEPFRQLLASWISQAHGVQLAEAVEAVPELVRWWKYKNRTHRALLSDDTGALETITAEFGIRKKREAERQALAERHQKLVRAVRQHAKAAEDLTDPILVAHKSGNKYVALIPYNEENVWVREQTWTLNRTTGAIHMNDEKEWKLVDKRHERWHIVYRTERWDSWTINPRRFSVLTDPELEEIVDRAFEVRQAEIEEEQNDPKRFHYRRRNYCGSGRDRRRQQRFWPLAAGVSRGGIVKIWYSDEGPILPEGRLFSRRPRSPVVTEATVSWTKNQDGINCLIHGDGSVRRLPWEPPSEVPRSPVDLHRQEPEYRLLRHFEDNIARVKAEKKSATDLQAQREALCDSVDHVDMEAAKYVRQRQEEAFYHEFLADHGDPTLWEDHKANLEFKEVNTHQILIACCLLLERYIEVYGLTAGEVIEQAMPFGLLSKKHDFENNFAEVDPNLPLDFIIPPPPEPEEAEISGELVPVENDDYFD